MEEARAVHLGGESRFCIEGLEDRTSLTYTLEGQELSLTHTWVDPALRGGNLASLMVQAAVDWADSQAFRIIPVCSYTLAWMRRHNRT